MILQVTLALVLSHLVEDLPRVLEDLEFFEPVLQLRAKPSHLALGHSIDVSSDSLRLCQYLRMRIFDFLFFDDSQGLRPL